MTDFGVFNGVKTSYRHSGTGKDVILLHGLANRYYRQKNVSLNEFLFDSS